MQTINTASIHPFPQKRQPMQQSAEKKRGVTRIMRPGEPIIISPDVTMEIAYDQENGEYTPRIKCWYQGKRIKDYPFDQLKQIDLSHTIQRKVSHIYTHSHPATGRPIESCVLIEITSYPFSAA